MTQTTARQTSYRPTTRKTSSRKPAGDKADGDRDPLLVSRFGPVEVDWPRSLGFFGGIGLAVGAGVIDPPLGLFIASVPFLKMIDLPRLPTRIRFVAQVFEGVSKPVGGDSEGTVRLVTSKGSSDEPVQSAS